MGLLLCLSLAASPAWAVEVLDVTSGDRSVRILVQLANYPFGVAILFAGGHGVLDIGKDGSLGWGRNNFLVRSAHHFREQGLTTVLIDAPEQLKGRGLYRHRDSLAHAQDVSVVTARMRARFGLPVFVVGTSRGTESVANAAVLLRGVSAADAVVLTASMLGANEGGKHLLAMQLDAVSVPTLIVHHTDDACHVTPFAQVPNLERMLSGAAKVDVLAYRGGTARGEPCKARHYHGFHGIEAQVVRDITQWLRGVPVR